MTIAENEIQPSLMLKLFAAVVAITILNDFVYLAFTVMGWATGYLITTFVSGIVILLVIFQTPLKVYAQLPTGVETRRDEGALSIILFIMALVFSGLIINPLSQTFPDMRWMEVLSYEQVWMGWMDITIGLALAAVIEELVYRRIAYRVFKQMNFDTVTLIAVSGMLVALSHWFSGPAKMADLLIVHVVFMLFYMRTQKIAPLIVANFLFNFFAYV